MAFKSDYLSTQKYHDVKMAIKRAHEQNDGIAPTSIGWNGDDRYVQWKNSKPIGQAPSSNFEFDNHGTIKRPQVLEYPKRELNRDEMNGLFQAIKPMTVFSELDKVRQEQDDESDQYFQQVEIKKRSNDQLFNRYLTEQLAGNLDRQIQRIRDMNIAPEDKREALQQIWNKMITRTGINQQQAQFVREELDRMEGRASPESLESVYQQPLSSETTSQASSSFPTSVGELVPYGEELPRRLREEEGVGLATQDPGTRQDDRFSRYLGDNEPSSILQPSHQSERSMRLQRRMAQAIGDTIEQGREREPPVLPPQLVEYHGGGSGGGEQVYERPQPAEAGFSRAFTRDEPRRRRGRPSTRRTTKVQEALQDYRESGRMLGARSAFNEGFDERMYASYLKQEQGVRRISQLSAANVQQLDELKELLDF